MSTSAITPSNFASATPVATSAPNEAGSTECVQVSDLTSCSTYYFALVASDADSNRSAMSNVASDATHCSGSIEVDCAYRPHTSNATRFTRGQAEVVGTVGACPNPSGGSVRIDVGAGRKVSCVEIFDLGGRRLRTYTGNAETTSGVQWDRRNEHGEFVGPGIYAYRAKVGDQVIRGKIVLVR